MMEMGFERVTLRVQHRPDRSNSLNPWSLEITSVSTAIEAEPGAIVGEITFTTDRTEELSAAEPQPNGQRGNPDSEPRNTRNTRKGQRHHEPPTRGLLDLEVCAQDLDGSLRELGSPTSLRATYLDRLIFRVFRLFRG